MTDIERSNSLTDLAHRIKYFHAAVTPFDITSRQFEKMRDQRKPNRPGMKP
jgi:hypothetical protein